MIRLYKHFTASKLEFFNLIILLLASSAFELLSTASVLVLVDIAINHKVPAFIDSYLLESQLSVPKTDVLLQALLLSCLFVFITSGILRYLYLHNSLSLVQRQRHEVSQLLLSRYIKADFRSNAIETSGEKARKILSESDNLIYTFYMPILNFFSSIIGLFFFLIGLILTINFQGLLAFSGLAFVFMIIFLFNRRRMKAISRSRNISNANRYDKAIQLLNAFKEIKVYGHINYFFTPFENASIKYSSSIALSQVVSQTPKIIIESIVLISLTVTLIYFSITPGEAEIDLSSSIPKFSAVAFIVIRSLPKIHIIFHSLSQLQIGKAILSDLDLLSPKINRRKSSYDKPIISPRSVKKIMINDFSMDNLGQYFKDKKIKINNLSNYSSEFTIGDIVLIKGESGLGKSTLLDSLAGFLDTDNSIQHISKDGSQLKSRDVLTSVSYVNQDPFIFNSSLFENITLSNTPTPNENFNKLLLELKINSLAIDRKNSPLGEDGKFISGGQAQRISIARALYKNSSLLLLDEPTSALDNDSKEHVCRLLGNVSRHAIVIIVTHDNLERFFENPKLIYLEAST